MKMNIKTIFLGALGVWLLALAPAQGATANAPTTVAPNDTNKSADLSATMNRLFGDPVIARGKDFEIKQSQLDDVMSGIKSAAAERNKVIPPQQLTLMKGEMLDRLIQVQLLLQKATPADKAEGTKTADAQMKTLLERAGSEQALKRQFMALGMSMDQLKKRLEQESTAQATLVRELHVKVSDAEAKQFYNEHPGEFEIPERVRIQQIFLSTRDPVTGAELPASEKASKKKEAEDILKKARGGADFEKLVKQYSDDPSAKAKQNGGEYTIARGQTLPEFESAAFSLNTNQISDVVSTASGYHIIKLLEKLPPKKLEYDTIADRLKKVLIQQKATKQAPPYLARLRKEEDVKIVDPDLKAAVERVREAATNAPATMPATPAGK